MRILDFFSRLAGYFPLFKVNIGQDIATLFTIVPSLNLLIVANQYKVNPVEDSSLGCNSVNTLLEFDLIRNPEILQYD